MGRDRDKGRGKGKRQEERGQCKEMDRGKREWEGMREGRRVEEEKGKGR